MCGISGSLVLSGAFELSEDFLAGARDTMVHRGPDGAGFWISEDRKVGLAHRRLSIIDLSAAANQPMAIDGGALRVVFNGEIYNHAEIRRELEALGYRTWQTDHSDTEVVLRAWAHWGPEALHRFRGMFAIAIWDESARQLWLVRDRMGIKPLYYSQHNGRLNFASEIKALFTDPGQRRAVNVEGLFHYLSFLATTAPESLFEGIKKLPNGCWLRISADGTIEERRWYDVWDHVTPQPNATEGELTEQLMAELRTAVRLRKVSDVPVGVFLSGGIDSSTNTALFSEDGIGAVNTFSIGYDQEYASSKSELPFAERVAQQFGTAHHARTLSMQQLLDFLPQMVHLQDEPIADPVCVPLYFLSRMAREAGVIVCQAGEGADELFLGYENWRRKWRLQRRLGTVAPRTISRLGTLALGAAGRGASKEAEALRRVAAGQPLFWGTTEAFTDAEKHALLSPRLKAVFRGRTSWEAVQPVWNRFNEKAWEKSWLNWMSYCDLSLRLPELLLMRLDKMTMGASLEGRVPFLDHKFVELVLSMPEARKVGDGNLKYLLKKAARGVTPDWVIDRKKQGFGVPVTEWFLGELGTYAHSTIAQFCDETDFFDRAEVDRLFHEKRDPRLWYLLNFALWWNEFIR